MCYQHENGRNVLPADFPVDSRIGLGHCVDVVAESVDTLAKMNKLKFIVESFVSPTVDPRNANGFAKNSNQNGILDTVALQQKENVMTALNGQKCLFSQSIR